MVVHPGLVTVLVHPLLSAVQLQTLRGGETPARPVSLGLRLLGRSRTLRPNWRLPSIPGSHVLPKVSNIPWQIAMILAIQQG